MRKLRKRSIPQSAEFTDPFDLSLNVKIRRINHPLSAKDEIDSKNTYAKYDVAKEFKDAKERLKEKEGCVKVECTFPDGIVCTGCEGESLSLRGFYSKKCSRKEGEKFKAKVIPIVEIGQAKPKHEFALSASVAMLHSAEGSEQSEGRGIFFEDGEEEVVKGLYEYISEHRK